MKQFDAQEINNKARTLDICICGERLVTGMQYEEINAAIAAVEWAGFEVKIPGGGELLTVPLPRMRLKDDDKSRPLLKKL